MILELDNNNDTFNLNKNSKKNVVLYTFGVKKCDNVKDIIKSYIKHDNNDNTEKLLKFKKKKLSKLKFFY